MDPTHVHRNNLTPKIPDAFERLRQGSQPPTNQNSAVVRWLKSTSPRLKRPSRYYLRQIQSNSNSLKLTESCAKLSQRGSRSRDTQQRMSDSHDPAKRGRGRPRGSGGRGSGGRGGRGITVNDSRDMSRIKDRATEVEDNQTDAMPSSLVLRPTETLSSSSRRSPTRSPTRSKTAAIVKRDQLALMTPAIRFVSHERATQRGGLPLMVNNLWTEHIHQALHQVAVVPSGLEERLTARFDTPRKSRPPVKSHLLDFADIYNGPDLDLLWMTFTDVACMADRYRDTAPESHWIATVVAPLLHLVRRLSCLNPDGENRPSLEVLDITTTEISPQSLCPYSEDPTLFKDLDKRIDYAVGLCLSVQERDVLEQGKYADYFPASINQTANFANLTPLFINVEVKRRYVEKDPMIQLGAWIAAEFNKRKVEGYSLGMPVFAIAIDGDLWELHIAYAESPLAADYRLNFLGPFDMGNTKSYQGMFQILNVLRCLAKWGMRDYRKWVEEEILKKYRPV